MYSFLMDQTYINLFILVSIVVLVMFLWRKLIILEGNFFILEKRVNLIKKDAREDSISKNMEKSDIIMNEIFKDFSPSNACKSFECPISSFTKIHSENHSDNLTINEDMVKYISAQTPTNLKGADKILDDVSRISPDVDIITFNKGGDAGDAEADDADAGDTGDLDKIVDKIVDTIINSSEDYEAKVFAEEEEKDNASVCSEITFTSDDKKGDKTLLNKYSKMSLDKLKDICGSYNINSEGTRKQLITRIIENSK
uniref:SAP domain-containing protein n=1 Tax=viral metagenome TaxID=1070528 RepID=A0A6C0IAP9_9ZZZZ